MPHAYTFCPSNMKPPAASAPLLSAIDAISFFEIKVKEHRAQAAAASRLPLTFIKDDPTLEQILLRCIRDCTSLSASIASWDNSDALIFLSSVRPLRAMESNKTHERNRESVFFNLFYEHWARGFSDLDGGGTVESNKEQSGEGRPGPTATHANTIKKPNESQLVPMWAKLLWEYFRREPWNFVPFYAKNHHLPDLDLSRVDKQIISRFWVSTHTRSLLFYSLLPKHKNGKILADEIDDFMDRTKNLSIQEFQFVLNAYFKYSKWPSSCRCKNDVDKCTCMFELAFDVNFERHAAFLRRAISSRLEQFETTDKQIDFAVAAMEEVFTARTQKMIIRNLLLDGTNEKNSYEDKIKGRPLVDAEIKTHFRDVSYKSREIEGHWKGCTTPNCNNAPKIDCIHVKCRACCEKKYRAQEKNKRIPCPSAGHCKEQSKAGKMVVELDRAWQEASNKKRRI